MARSRKEREMNSESWVSCVDPNLMLRCLLHHNTRLLIHETPRLSFRKLRLFAVACCRFVWNSLASSSREAIGVAERFADDNATQPELQLANLSVNLWDVGGLACSLSSNMSTEFVDALSGEDGRTRRSKVLVEQQSDILREIVGNPFVPLTSEQVPSSPGRMVASLAQAAYEERLQNGELDRVRLNILADALDDDRYSDDSIIHHLRSAGFHARGCWALDVVLGKERLLF